MNFLPNFLDSGALISLDAETLQMGWGKRIFAKQFPVFYFNDFFLENPHPFFHYELQLTITPKELLAQLPAGESAALKWSVPSWDIFKTAFESKLQKIVPYVQKSAPFEMTSPNLASRLRAALSYLVAHPQTAIYGCWEEGKGTLGVTPEVLFRLQPGKPLSTMACAGTFSGAEWQNNQKLLQEHQLVIEGIKEELSPFGSLQIGKTEPRQFSKLTHLVTPIEFHGSMPVESLIEKLHPTPALGGFPKEESTKWLKSYAKELPRNGFGAPFGILLDENTGVFYVAIRNMEWNAHEVILRAGCGITAKSCFDEEQLEAENKLQAIQEILAL